MSMLQEMGKAAKKASKQMALASTEQKNEVIHEIAKALQKNKELILKANQVDIDAAKEAKLNDAMIDRLSLFHGRLEGMINDLHQVIKLPDPIGAEIEQKTLPNGLEVSKKRVPLGVLGIIYESRPNVTIDVAALTLKTGNCAILRGGSETLHTNESLVKVIQDSLDSKQLPISAIQLVGSKDREQVRELLRMHDTIDLIIPRGGENLHRFCRENSTIPVITGGIGICHLFIDETADQHKAVDVILNAKTQRPTVCNALDTILVHTSIAKQFIPLVIEKLEPLKVSFRLDERSMNVLNKNYSFVSLAKPEDWNTEWLSLILGIKVVDNMDEAIKHIHQYSTAHSDGILTENKKNAERFVQQVDSAAVYVNASTRFTDGGQLGLGAEVAISTQKLHARGPMGLEELTSYKWVIHGDYHTRS